MATTADSPFKFPWKIHTFQYFAWTYLFGISEKDCFTHSSSVSRVSGKKNYQDITEIDAEEM